MSVRGGDAGDSDDLSAPLLEDDGGGLGRPMGEGGGAVTLHGEPVDLRDLLFGATADAGANDDNVSAGGDSDGEQGADGDGLPTNDRSPTSASTLSLDNQSANTNPVPSKLDYARQTLLYLPRKGRALYYRARYGVVGYFSSRGSRNSGGLTPVETASVTNNDSAHGSNRQQRQSRSRRRDQITQKSSLSSAQSTPLLLKLLIPPLLIANHVLFYRAQTEPMWNLAYKTNVTISATASTLKSKAAADAMNLPHHYDYVSRESSVIETFTYMDAIRKLWKGEGLGDAQTISKVAAALLVVFSGIWPHLKLFLVHVCWFFPFAHGLWLRGDDDDCDDPGGAGGGRSMLRQN